ncbi:MAG: MopE-related protein, partial [Flavobacteriales bacterium]|nr:MopE-related protein [Flavobacteriales bacterium]
AAGCDDGSCLTLDACGICGGSSIAGCTDVNACNFNPAAGCDDGSCTYPTTYYTDADGDGFGAAPAVSLCAPQVGFVLDNTDCDDTLDTVYPGAMGTGEGLDNDCNGLVEGNEVAPCIGDFNQDGFINVGDLLVLLGQFGCTESCPTDMNNDGAVNAGDMLIFFGLFNTSCP